MGTAAFGSGILKGLDVPGAIDLLTGFLDQMGDYDESIAGLAPSEQLEALLMLTAGDGVTMTWDAGREQLSIEIEDEAGRAGVARALGLLAVCLRGPADLTMLDEAGRSWRYVLAGDEVTLRPAGMNFDDPMLALSMSAPTWRSLYDQPIGQDSGGRWGDAPEERSQTMAPDDEINGEALFEELEAEVDALLANEGGELQAESGATQARPKQRKPMGPANTGPAMKKH